MKINYPTFCFHCVAAIILTVSITLSSCDCHLNDFRNPYIGRYQVHVAINSYGTCWEPYSNEYDTIISVTYGESDSSLLLMGREIYLDADGYFYEYHYGCRLWSDSVWSSYMNGGLGCGQYETYLGHKISNKL